ncbi:MAG TPA: hypothetical protein VGF67_32900, partial [Ktedonobacteraceae bacterium]
MQTDTWLTDASHPDRCPLCSQSLAAGSNICPSCGFTAHEPARGASAPVRALSARQPGPLTPIPARASALRSQRAAGGASSRPGSSQPAPFSTASRQARGLRHDSPNYEAVSSLSSLSLIIAETPTAPPRTTTHLAHADERRWHIDEIDTVPQRPEPGVQESQAAETPAARSADLEGPGRALVPAGARPPLALAGIDEIDTVPEAGPDASSALQPLAAERRPGRIGATSWRAGPPHAAQQLAPHGARARSVRTRRFSPLDRTRWWLLRPGHIEFLLWLAGSVLLFGITFLFLLSLVLSALLPGAPVGGNFPRSNASGSSSVATPPVTGGIRLELAGSATLASGSELHLLGQGFRPSSQITFWLDGHWSLLDQRGRSALTRAGADGRFAVDLWLGQGPDWSAGRHQILARAMDNGGQATISISIASAAATPASRPNNPGPRS